MPVHKIFQGPLRPLIVSGKFLLAPLGMLYQGISWLRWTFRRPQRLPVPVLSIGNLVAGGTGKTPCCVWLCRQLRDCGWNPGILSRGYGARASARGALVDPGCSDWREFGDEPLLLARLTGQPVAICADRRRGARLLLAAGVDCILMDDAFSNHQLAKDFEILLLDARRPHDNGLGLPAGRLREFPRAARRADALIATRAPGHWTPPRDRAAMHFQTSLDLAPGTRINAFSALGNNQAFRRSLEDAGYVVEQFFALPDHQPIDRSRLLTIAADGLPLVTTAKDAIKLERSLLPLVQVAELHVEMSHAERILEPLEQCLRLWRTAGPGEHQPTDATRNARSLRGSAGASGAPH